MLVVTLAAFSFLPSHSRSRYHQEWMAELEEIQRQHAGHLRAAFRILLDTPRMRWELIDRAAAAFGRVITTTVPRRAVELPLTTQIMRFAAWLWSRRRRKHSRAELEAFLERNRPGGSDLDKLIFLIGLVFWNCPDPRDVMIARARHRGVRADRIDQLLRGDVAFSFRWDVIEDLLRECGADPVVVEVAHDLFHDFPRGGALAAIGQTAGAGIDPPTGDSRWRGRPPAPEPGQPGDIWTGLNCSVLLIDVTGFGAPTRTDADRRVIRQIMYRTLHESFKSANIPWDACRHEDRGDGVLIVIPPAVLTKQIVHPLVDRLAEGLARHNDQADEGTRFQLRAALDVGPVEVDAEGVNGEAIIYAARLVEAQVFKQRLRQSGMPLGFIASAFVYDRFVKHRPGQVDPAGYQKIRAGVKESKFTAWMHLAPDARDDHTR
jgi:hypothetical protein